jgi:hypothetical protein
MVGERAMSTRTGAQQHHEEAEGGIGHGAGDSAHVNDVGSIHVELLLMNGKCDVRTRGNLCRH